jgi:hypothetical protein
VTLTISKFSFLFLGYLPCDVFEHDFALQPVTFEVLVDVWPTPELKGDYTGMTVISPNCSREPDK